MGIGSGNIRTGDRLPERALALTPLFSTEKLPNVPEAAAAAAATAFMPSSEIAPISLDDKNLARST
jgi:hypothetical protein